MTLPAVITRDPKTGTRNVGMYRMQKIDAKTTYMHWQIHKDGAADWRGMGDRLDVAVALGCDPITTYSASAPLPKHVDEFMLAGFFRGSPVELVKAKTVDLEVPANAEIVLEGYIEKGELGTEGPFGDHTGYYSPPEPFPIFHLTAMTMRRDAIYPSIVVGVPPAEDAWLGKATERIFLPAVRMTLPEIVDYDLPVAGAFHNCVIVSMRKAYPGHARKIMHAIWGLGPALALEVGRRRGRVRERARLRRGLLPRLRERRPEARPAPLGRAARPARPLRGCVLPGREAWHRRDPQDERGGRPRLARADRDDRRSSCHVSNRWSEYGLGGVGSAGKRRAFQNLRRKLRL